MNQSTPAAMNGPVSSVSAGYFAWRAARHCRRLGLSIMVAGLMTTMCVSRWVSPVYRSETVLIMHAFPGAPIAREAGARLQEMLLSSERLAAIAAEMHLYPEFQDVSEKVDAFKRAIEFKIQPGSTFLIAFRGGTPDEAQVVTRRLAESLIQDDARLRTLEARRNNTFLEGEKFRLEQEVRQRESELQAFLRQHPEVTLQSEIDTPMGAGPDTVVLERELEKLRQIQERSLFAGTSTAGDPDLVQARRVADDALKQARQDLVDKRNRLTDQHPDVILATHAVERAEMAARRARQAEDSAPQPSSGAESGRITKQLELLERKLALVRTNQRTNRRDNSRKLAALQVQYQSMRHIVDDTRARLSRLEEQQFQAQMLEKAQAEEGLQLLAILDPAYRPAIPTARRRLKIVIGGGLASLILGVMVSFVRSVHSDRLFEAIDAQNLAGATVLVSVPRTRGVV